MRPRIIVIGVFAVCGIGLFLAGRVLDSPGTADRAGASAAGDGAVTRAIDLLFDRYHIDKGAVRTRRVAIPGRGFARIEQRCAAPPGFLGLMFNHDLSTRLAQVGARVIAVEHTKDNSLSVYVVSGHTVIRSIVFALPPSSGGSSPRAGM